MRVGRRTRAPELTPHAYAIVAPGFEEVAAAELRALAFDAVEPQPGGVAFAADTLGLVRANLWLRSASRVLSVVAGSKLRNFEALVRFAESVPWDRYLPPGRAVKFHVTSIRSRLYHERAIADRLAAVVGPGAGEPAVQVFVRLLADRITIAVDTSGDLLHRRGYRTAIGEAPLRETLAAGILLAAGYDGSAPLVDPMCGSGTFAVEAALIASHRAPGAGRAFDIEDWPSTPREAALTLRSEAAQSGARPHPPIAGFDRDAKVIEAARANAARAGMSVDFDVCDAATLARPTSAPGLVVANPPYGRRLGGDADALRTLVALAGRFGGWRSLILHTGPGTPKGFTPLLRFKNGGITVRVLAK